MFSSFFLPTPLPAFHWTLSLGNLEVLNTRGGGERRPKMPRVLARIPQRVGQSVVASMQNLHTLVKGWLCWSSDGWLLAPDFHSNHEERASPIPQKFWVGPALCDHFIEPSARSKSGTTNYCSNNDDEEEGHQEKTKKSIS